MNLNDRSSLLKTSLIIILFAALPCSADVLSGQKSQISHVRFTSTPVPSSEAEYSKTYTKSKAIIQYSDGTKKEFPLRYQKLFGVKDKIGNNKYAAGQLYKQNGSPIMDPFDKPLIAETPDGNSLLNIAGQLYLITQYEYDWILSNGNSPYDYAKWHHWPLHLPMAMTLTSIQQTDAGLLKAIDQSQIDFSNVNGLHVPCFASQTPWNTHLGSEENYSIDAYKIEKNISNALNGLNEFYFDSNKKANPYHYGIIPEVSINSDGTTNVVKHFAMGRATWEMAKVMPDQRTVYLASDGLNQPFIMFIADKDADLSAGTLYAAKWQQQTHTPSGGSATLKWIKLGHGRDTKIKKLADKTVFSNIFQRQEKQHPGYQSVRANSSSTEYLKLKAGMDHAAAFLETARYAAYRGATAEFNKVEGITLNNKDRRIYIAISQVAGGMLNSKNSPADDIQLKKINTGAIYELELKTNQKDMQGNPINSSYVATSIKGLLTGENIDTDETGNKASIEKIANPDNIFFSEKMRTLFIAEDSGLHVNNFVWAYHVDDGALVRLLSVVAGAESSGLQVAENINGYSYIMSNAQHQGSFIGSMDKALKKKLKAKIDRFDASVGYIYGLPQF